MKLIKYYPDLNHESERWDAQLWGTDGGFTKSKVGSSGLLYTTVKQAFPSSSIPNGKKIGDL